MFCTSEIGYFLRCLWGFVFSSVKEDTWDISWLSAFVLHQELS